MHRQAESTRFADKIDPQGNRHHADPRAALMVRLEVTGLPDLPSAAAAASNQRPALVPLTFDGDAWAPYASLAGLSLPVRRAVRQCRPERFDRSLP